MLIHNYTNQRRKCKKFVSAMAEQEPKMVSRKEKKKSTGSDVEKSSAENDQN